MGPLDTVSLTILLGAALVLVGILSSLVALRFGAPLLLVFLLLGMAAGDGGLGIKFDDVRTTYLVGSVALALILFDGGLRTRFATFRSVLGPALSLATVGVLISALLAAPIARLALGLGWRESLLVGAMVASTDAAAVFFLIHARGLRLRPRVGATLEVESGTNDPFAIFLTLTLVQLLLAGQEPWWEPLASLIGKGLGGAAIGFLGGRITVWALNRLDLAQGLHAPFVATSVLVVFALSETVEASGFLAVYVAGLIVGNRPTRAHNNVVVFFDAATWLAQIVMFVLLGLLVGLGRLPQHLLPALVIALGLMFVARPVAVFFCLLPFRFSRREKLFMSWVGLRGAVGIFLASIPLLVGLPNAQLYFDVGFVVVLVSLAGQGWTIATAAHRLHIALPHTDPPAHRVELDLPGQLAHELVGYRIGHNNPYLRRHLMPSWAKPMLIVRNEQVLSSQEAGAVREGDHLYLLAPPEKAQALDRFFVDMPPPSAPDPRLLGDFFVPGSATLGTLAEIYGLTIAPNEHDVSLTDYFAQSFGARPHKGDLLSIGPIALVAHRVYDGRVTQIGLRLAEPDPDTQAEQPASPWQRAQQTWKRVVDRLRPETK
jgi:potassium/hydrogen antiporter